MLSHHRPHRRNKVVLVALTVLALTAASCTSKDDEGGGASSDGDATTASTAPAEEVLGEENPATDTPITIGVVTDGQASFGNTEILDSAIDASIQYANDYLGGINGHTIEVQKCATDGTPAGATQCAVEMTSAEVAAVLVPVSAQDTVLFEGFADSGIPYFTYTSASEAVLLQDGAFLLTNPISQIAVPALTAQEEEIEKVAFVIIDVPAATGPITSIAQPIFDNVGVELQVVPIAPSVADMTPQIQEAIGGGAELFSITGTDDFIISAVNALHQLGFDGTISLGNPSQAIIDGIDDVEDIVATGTSTEDPEDEDWQLFQAINETYMGGVEPDTQSAQAFSLVTAFVEALQGTDAVDAETISTALGSMPEPIDLPVGGGITFQCGSDPVSFAPNICSTDVLQWSYDADGQRTDFGLVDVPDDLLG